MKIGKLSVMTFKVGSRVVLARYNGYYARLDIGIEKSVDGWRVKKDAIKIWHYPRDGVVKTRTLFQREWTR